MIVPTKIESVLSTLDRYRLTPSGRRGDEPEEILLEGLHFAPDGAGGFRVECDGYVGRFDEDPALLRLQSVMDYYRREKRRRYERHLNGGYKGLKCLAEGDSWFELPPFVYATDIVRELWDDYAVLSLAKAGDAWSNILKQDELFPTVAEEAPDVVLLSAGGNNILGSIELFVHHWSPSRGMDDYVNEEFDYELNKIIYYTDLWVSKLVSMGCDVIMHGYGYGDPRPRLKGGWLVGGPLSDKRNINDQRIWRAVISEMVNRFNTRLIDLSRQKKFGGKFRFLDLRTVLGKGDEWWEDEIHPTKKGFSTIADRFRDELKAIAVSKAIV